MSIQAHIDSLEEKRLQLKGKIAEESAHPSLDFAKITELKKQKLAIKEEIQKYGVMLQEKLAATS